MESQGLIVFCQEENLLTEMRRTAKKTQIESICIAFPSVYISTAKFLTELSILPASQVSTKEKDLGSIRIIFDLTFMWLHI